MEKDTWCFPKNLTLSEKSLGEVNLWKVLFMGSEMWRYLGRRRTFSYIFLSEECIEGSLRTVDQSWRNHVASIGMVISNILMMNTFVSFYNKVRERCMRFHRFGLTKNKSASVKSYEWRKERTTCNIKEGTHVDVVWKVKRENNEGPFVVEIHISMIYAKKL